jgi:hypothetical protein
MQAARALVVRRDGATAKVWPRAAALLARQSLEATLDDYWSRHPTMAQVRDTNSRRTQLICLRTAIDPETARQLAYVWSALSESCHYHPYELSPTAAELTGWFDAVESVTTALAAA